MTAHLEATARDESGGLVASATLRPTGRRVGQWFLEFGVHGGSLGTPEEEILGNGEPIGSIQGAGRGFRCVTSTTSGRHGVTNFAVCAGVVGSDVNRLMLEAEGQTRALGIARCGLFVALSTSSVSLGRFALVALSVHESVVGFVEGGRSY